MSATIWERTKDPYRHHKVSSEASVSDVLAQFPGSTALFECGEHGEIIKARSLARDDSLTDGGHYALVFGATTKALVDSHRDYTISASTSALPGVKRTCDDNGNADNNKYDNDDDDGSERQQHHHHHHHHHHRHGGLDTSKSSKELVRNEARGPKIMVAIDDHKPGRWALRWALSLAKQTQTYPSITVFHAVDAAIVIAWEGEDSAAAEHFRDKAEETIEKVISGLDPRELAGVRIQRSAVIGNPADSIVEASIDFDLIVMGTHARKGVKRFVLGSVCEAVMRHAIVPVFTVKFDPILSGGASDPEEATPPVGVSTVLLPVSSADVSLLESAIMMCRMLGAAIKVVHIIPSKEPKQEEIDEANEVAQWYIERINQRTGVEVKKDVIWNKHPAEGILALAAGREYGAVVIGTHGRSGIQRIAIGSVCETVSRNCSVPVIVVGTGKVHPLESSQGFVAFDTVPITLDQRKKQKQRK